MVRPGSTVSHSPIGTRSPPTFTGCQTLATPTGMSATVNDMNQGAPRSRPVRVCYYMQTHTKPAQIARLVELIKEGSPESVVLINHDASRASLDASRFRSMPG